MPDNAAIPGKLYNPTNIKPGHMSTNPAGKPKVTGEDPFAKIPETCWVIGGPEEVKLFHEFLDHPREIPKHGAMLMDMSRNIANERREKRRAKAKK